jgi:hypothetical protein
VPANVSSNLLPGNLFHRAEEYWLPEHMSDHIYAVFNVVQTPPAFRTKFAKPVFVNESISDRLSWGKNLQSAAPYVSIPFLNSLYQINSNAGSPSLGQAVFETNGENFSPSDLKLFQTIYGMPQQDVIDLYNLAIATCTTAKCAEGNLDLQYIMGVAQNVQTYYWYTPPTGDPFVNWILDVASNPDPPQSHSISWGSIEPVKAILSFSSLIPLLSSSSLAFSIPISLSLYAYFCSN